MTEVWKDIPDYEGLYQASNLGKVRSLPRTAQYVNKWGKKVQYDIPGGVRTVFTHYRSGHLYVGLWKEGKQKHWFVHTLVLSAFVGPCPDGMECLHGDGNPANNRVENLRWGTPSNNTLDSVRHGTHANARKTHCKWGHEFSPDNTYVTPNGRRVCRTCRKLRQRKRDQRNISE